MAMKFAIHPDGPMLKSSGHFSWRSTINGQRKKPIESLRWAVAHHGSALLAALLVLLAYFWLVFSVAL
jgi:hypothetical protein